MDPISIKNTDFVHLHVHTEYSLLDGANRIKDLLQRAAGLGMKSIAITDHGVMYGVVDFYKEAVKNGIKPILGCEVYIAKRSRFDKQSGIDSDQGHLVLLASDLRGYRNLMKIVSFGFTEGFYYKPRVDYELLEAYSEGLIALSACLSGNVAKALLQNDYDTAKKTAERLNGIFGQDKFFLELQSNGIEEQNLVNQGLIRLSRETGIPLVATNDVHYLRRTDAKAHEVLLCIQTGKKISDEDRMKFSSDDFYLKSAEEMSALFKNVPEALENTVRISERCNVELEFNKLHLPEFRVEGGIEPFEYLRKLCYEGLAAKQKQGTKQGDGSLIPDSNETQDPSLCPTSNLVNETQEPSLRSIASDNSLAPLKVEEPSCRFSNDRLEYELSVIKQMGYVDYFLIVWDFIKYAKDHGIMVGPGRGAAAGSQVAYSLGITSIDPMKYNLLFERFLNPERISMPDIDIDFCYERRQEVIDYVVSKYGKDRVAQIITFGTMAARAAIRDVGRALDISYGEVDAVAKMIPFQIGMNIDKALELNPELKLKYEDEERIKELIDTARLLEGMPRHASTHAAGVVISKEPITEYVPLQKNEDSITTQFPMGLLEELGLLKMDFLGLRTLTVIRDSMELILKNHGKKIDIDNLEMDDPNVFKMIGEGKTAGIFQLESGGMTQFMKELQPSSLEDIIAGISLYRPGPMEQIPRYIKNKNNPSEAKYAHPLLEKILDVTYGCMVYQEQVMQIVRELAGYSYGRSDLVRRAMSKKKHDVMEKERKNFIHGITDDEGKLVVEGAIRRGVDEKTANSIFDEMTDFASYAFNKSHAAAYAVIAYQTAWLKYYYPVEFMAASLNSFMGSGDKISQYVQECRTMGIDVLPPDINESEVRFSVVDGKIRFGMAAVKNVGEGAVSQIIAEKNENGYFKGFTDFCERTGGRDINKRCVESLLKCGAFDSFGIFRSRMIAVYEKVLDSVGQNRKRNMEGQLSIFEMGEAKQEISISGEIYPEIKEYPPKMLLSMEKEMLGLYISGHPLKEFEEEIKEQVTLFSSDLGTNVRENGEDDENEGAKGLKDGMPVTVGGIITEKKSKTTKSNNLMAFITLEDLYGSMEVIVFPSTLTRFAALLTDENTVLINGKISIKEEEQPKIICEEVRPLRKNYDDTANPSVKTSKLYIRTSEPEECEKIRSVYSLLKYFHGKTPVCFYNELDNTKRMMDQDKWVCLGDSLLKELRERFGEENVKVT
ncbi:MAG: DNA polymerase III subunit alpha [Ruminiclostridium sp.]|nr:DNA polymerase III subunit alpha [Ruminiclostridium sp.]